MILDVASTGASITPFYESGARPKVPPPRPTRSRHRTHARATTACLRSASPRLRPAPPPRRPFPPLRPLPPAPAPFPHAPRLSTAGLISPALWSAPTGRRVARPRSPATPKAAAAAARSRPRPADTPAGGRRPTAGCLLPAAVPAAPRRLPTLAGWRMFGDSVFTLQFLAASDSQLTVPREAGP